MTKNPIRLKALGDNVLVDPISPNLEAEELGLHTVDSHDRKVRSGKVVSVGKGRQDNRPKDLEALQEGVTVLYRSYAGDPKTVNGKDYLFISFDDILGIEEA